MNFAKKHSKKAQMELLGIAVVVVFISLGIYFLVKFNITNEPAQAKRVFAEGEVASSMISAMITTTAEECNGKDLLELMIDCADYKYSGGNIICKTDGIRENRSCEYLNYTLDFLFNQTLDTWKKSYEFNITTLNGMLVEPVWGRASGSCLGEKRSSQFFFETRVRGTMLIRLDICS